MECSLTKPEMDGTQKRSLNLFLRAAFVHTELCAAWPSDISLAIYLDGQAHIIYQHSYWTQSAPYLYIGRTNSQTEYPKGKRLAVLLTLVQLCDDEDGSLTLLASQALSRYLLSEYNQARKSLVVADVPAKGLAFATDNRVAALLDSEWFLPGGETVDVSGAEWTVCKL